MLTKVSNKMGMPMLLAFIILGMLFGSDGIFKIPFDNSIIMEQIATIALIFIIFYGGFGTKWDTAKPIVVKAVVLSTLGVILTALFVGLKAPHNRLSKNGIEYIVRKTGAKAGVEKAHPHRFRRTAITNAINRGMPFQEAMMMAGHEKADTTKLYCTTDQESLRIHHKKFLCA